MKKSKRVFLCMAMVLLLLMTSVTIGSQPVLAADAPKVTGAEIQVGGRDIAISFDQVMVLSPGYEQGFEVKVNNSYLINKGGLDFISNEDHTKYVLHLNDAIQSGQTVTLSYTGVNVQSASGVALAAFSNYAVTNNLGGTPPVQSGPSVRRPTTEYEWGRHLSITFSKNMSTTPPIDPTGFTVMVDGINNPVTEILVKPGFEFVYYLKLMNLIRPDQNATVSYTPGTVTAADGGKLAAFSAMDNVTNDVPLRLSNISLSGAPSNYTFNSETTTYNGVTVAANVESITVVPTGLGVITVNGTTVASGATSAAIPLIAGVEQSITVHTVLASPVYYQNYKPITYTINITREAPQATPTFNPAAGPIADGTLLEIISSGAEHIYYTLDGTDPATSATGTTLEYNDSARPVVNGGTTVKAIAVKAGKVNSLIGSASYTLLPSSDLTALELSGNPENYIFDGATYSYHSVTVANSVSSIMIAPTGTGDITVDGVPVSSGTSSGAIYLPVGAPKTITVSVKETGKSAKLYTVVVTRNFPPIMAPTFNPSAGAIADGTPIQIICPDSTIYYTLDGTDPATAETGTTTRYNNTSRPAISHGTTVKAIAVKAGVDNSPIASVSYTWAASSDLTGLELSGNPSNFTFASSKYNYTAVSVANSVASVTVRPTGTGTITVDGTPVSSGTSSGAIDLTAVASKTITVSATETGKSPKTYSITITRANPNTGSPGGGGGGTLPVSAATATKEVAAVGTTPYVTGVTTVQAANAGSNGNAKAAVTEKQFADAADMAVSEAAKLGKDAKAGVKVKIEASSDAKSVETSIPMAAVKLAADINLSGLTVSTPLASLTFDDKTISYISKEAEGDVCVTVARADRDALSDEAKQIVGDRPVYDFSVTSGSKNISSFAGNVTVTVPYKLKPGEDPNAIIICYINAEGQPEIVAGCVYDSAAGKITFTATHFSKYAVGYNKASFVDVADNAWYQDAVSFIAARGITTGTGDNRFNPNASLTRGQFVVMLMRACGITPGNNRVNDNFADAGSTYYTKYLAEAKKLGITVGKGNNSFDPDGKISRQDMFVMLYRALDKMDSIPVKTSGLTISDFSDAGSVGGYAKEGLNALITGGIVSGGDGKLSPLKTCTRAEMAQVLENFLSK